MIAGTRRVIALAAITLLVGALGGATGRAVR
jgi:hypothetical protein